MSTFKRNNTDRPGVFFIKGTSRLKRKSDSPEEVAKTTEKIFYIMYYLDGKKIEEKAGRESEGMTLAKAAKLRDQRIHGVTLPNRERRKLRKEQEESVANTWTINRLWAAYKENRPTLKGIVTDENRFKNYLEPFAGLTPSELTTGDIDRLRLKLLQAGKAAQTVKNILELLRRIINFGVKKGLCPWPDPSRLHFEMPRVNNVKTEMLTQEQRQRLLEALGNARNRKAASLMLLAYYTGMRRGELFRLKWENIDWENGFIHLVGEGQQGAKSGKDERIPLSGLVRELLANQEQGDSPYVFSGKGGKGHLTDITKQANRIKEEAGLAKDFRALHGLRHTFASVAVSNGVPLSIVQKLLTHKSPQLTQRYAHLEDDALKQAANSVGAWLEANGKAEK
ncbi:MAG: site-specific integrase [Proteobacteria bacterium]|nr:site-specific integrase [Pseudomonadota bacterium]MBU1595448.1 site-specific integrase [Pseudomonadota bacterium]